MERRAQGHRVDHELCVVRELQPDDLEQVGRGVRSDREHSWRTLRVRIGVGLEVDDHDRVVDRMEDRAVVDSVLAGRGVDFHTALS